MRTWPLVLLAIGACGPIYPDQQPARAPVAEPSQASGPPGGGADPWAGSDPAAPGDVSAAPGPAGEPDDPYGAPGPGAAPGTAMGAPAPAPGKAAPAPGKAAPASGLPAHAQALLDAHNRVRAQHCAAPLTWSPKLAQVAQQWANTLRDRGCKFEHSGGRYGENLAAGTSGTLDAGEVTDMWYGEVKLYAFPDGGFSMETGHFTQVVWRGTTQLGCGVSTCRGMDIWVCEYDPPGNVQGQYRQNVLPTSCQRKR